MAPVWLIPHRDLDEVVPVLAPMLEAARAAMFSKNSRTWLVVPDGTVAAGLRQVLQRAGVALAGVPILHLSALRRLLWRANAAAARVEVSSAALEMLAASWVARGEASDVWRANPSLLVRAAALAGGHPAFDSPVGEAGLVTAFGQELAALGVLVPGELNGLFEWVEVALPAATKIGFVGFGPRHFQHLAVLRAACRAAEEVWLTLPEPRDDLPGQAWRTYWESQGQVVFPPVSAVAAPFVPLAQAAEADLAGVETSGVAFELAQDPGSEVEVLARQVVRYLAEETCRRLVVLLPKGSPQARLLPLKLAEMGLSGCDLAETVPAPTADERRLRHWITAQQTDAVGDWLGLVKDLDHRGEWRAELAQAAEEARAALLSVDRAVVAAAERLGGGGPWAQLEAAFPRLPEEGAFATLWQLAGEGLGGLKLDPGLLATLTSEADLLARWEPLVSREDFLAWMGAVGRSRNSGRPAAFGQPLSRLILAPWDAWPLPRATHVIVGGLNRQEAAFSADDLLLSEGLRQQLSARWREWVLTGQAPESIPLWLPLGRGDRERDTEHALFDALAGTEVAVTLSACLREATGDRGPLPWHRVYEACLRATRPDDRALPEPRVLAAGTATRFPAPRAAANLATAQVAAAYAQRRANVPFGAFDGGFAEAPSEPLEFSARAWEGIFQDPFVVWLRQVLRAEEPTALDEVMAAPLTVGSWVHGWLAVGPTVEAVRAEAERVRAWAEGVFAAAGRSVPDLWRGRWAMSRCRALDLARQVEGLAPMGVETEVTLGPCVVSAGGRGLRVRGRADVVLQLPRGLLVLDYKTGEAADLRADHVLGGRGLQVVLYALALSAERGVPVSCAIVRPGCPLAEPLDPGEVAGLKAVLEELAAIGHRGVLGPPFWPAQQQTDRLSGYPLAVMPLPYPLFAGRWELTHPGLEAPK